MELPARVVFGLGFPANTAGRWWKDHMKYISSKLLCGAVVVAAVLSMATHSATAIELFSASIDQVVRGAEGDVIEVAVIDVPTEHVGATCDVVGQTENQESVHDGNDLLIVGTVQTFTIANFEDEGFAVHQAGQIDSLPEIIRVFVRLGPDGVSSGGFRVSIECDDSGDLGEETEATTTTVAAPTTTAPTETTVATTDTTAAPTETTAVTTETTAATTETTAAAATTSTTAADTSSQGETGGGDDDLAATGATTSVLALTGALLIASGAGLHRVSRRQRR